MTEHDFFNHQPLAIFGVSSHKKSFGVIAFQELRKIGVSSYAINPKGGMAVGQQIYRSLTELPERPQAAVILTKGEGATSAVEECSRAGINLIWLQGASDTAELRRLCKELELQVVSGPCILLQKGGFPHSLHRFFHNLFRKK